MKHFFKSDYLIKYKKRIVSILVFIILIAFFHVVKHNKDLVTFYTTNISTPLKSTVAGILSFYRYSVAEIIVYRFILFIAAYILYYIYKVFMVIIKKNSSKPFYSFFINSTFITLLIFFLLTYLWGANYYSKTFVELSGIKPSSYSVEQLYNTTVLFADGLTKASTNISRNDDGTADIDVEKAIDDSQYIYDNIETVFPFLKGHPLKVKPLYFSVMLSFINTTGIMFPLTGEANINSHAPPSTIPATITHEISHQRNIASEDEANFVGILAAILSNNPDYVYSGYLSGYTYLSNALYRENPELFAEVFETLPAEVVADLRYINEYWDRFDTAVSETSEQLYDDFLKSYDQPLGIKSYGAVVDLLIEYFVVLV